MSDIIFIYTTVSSKEEALSIAQKLVDEGLIACANINDTMASVYRWENKVNIDSECSIILKTSQTNKDKQQIRLNELHPYDCPCIAVIDINEINPAYESWLLGELK